MDLNQEMNLVGTDLVYNPYVSDLVNGIISVLGKGMDFEAFNLRSGKINTTRQVVETILKVVGRHPPRIGIQAKPLARR